MPFCENCGSSLPDGARFCTECGTKVVPEPAESVFPPAPEAPAWPWAPAEAPSPAQVPSYTSPTGYTAVGEAPSYTPYASYSPAMQTAQTPKNKRKSGVTVLIVVGVVLVFLIAVVALVISLWRGVSADTAEVDPYVGTWVSITYQTEDMELDADVLGKSVLTLYADGTASLELLGEVYPGVKWSRTDNGIALSDDVSSYDARLVDDTLVMDFYWVNVTFVREGSENDDLTATQRQWEGDWYGSFWISATQGDYWEDMNNYFDDIYGYIYLDEYGDGWLEATDVDDWSYVLLSMYIKADEDHFEQVGSGAWFNDMDIIEGENGLSYTCTPVDGNPDMFQISARYVDPEISSGDEGFDFVITLLRWGCKWDYNVDIAPPGYSDYLNEING